MKFITDNFIEYVPKHPDSIKAIRFNRTNLDRIKQLLGNNIVKIISEHQECSIITPYHSEMTTSQVSTPLIIIFKSGCKLYTAVDGDFIVEDKFKNFISIDKKSFELNFERKYDMEAIK
jgi:hypothetical protein